jgi:hypothetical protein
MVPIVVTVNEHYLRLFRTPYLKVIILSDTDPYPNTDAVPYLAQVGHQRRRGGPPDVVTHRRFAAAVCGSGARLAAVADRR